MGKLGLLSGLQQVIGLHRDGVALAYERVDDLVPERWREERPGTVAPVKYVSRNFFSLLLLTVYRALGMRDEEIRWLAGVNHAIRSVVTAADNLIDDEDKPVLPLALPDGAVRFRNTLGLLAWGMAFERIVAQGAVLGALPAERAWLAALRAGVAQGDVREACAASTGRVVARALETATAGFAHMERAGYPLRANEARALVETLFRARGEAALLDLARRHG